MAGDDGLAEPRGLSGEGAQEIVAAQRLQEKENRFRRIVVEQEAADFADRQVELVADGDQFRESGVPRLPVRQDRTDEAAALGDDRGSCRGSMREAPGRRWR